MYKKLNVVMLPTNKKAIKDELFIDSENQLDISCMNIGCRFNAQHLYLTSDEEIKDGDYGLSVLNEVVLIGKSYDKSLYKKIIATTDNTLKIKTFYEIESNQEISLPKPSQQFIQYYIEEYNKGNIIKEVEVEYEDLTEQLQESIDNLRDNCLEDFDNEEESPYYHLLEQAIIELNNYTPKLNVNVYNIINIKPIKTSWSKEYE